MKYAALQVTSNFSFLRGASHPEELVAQAAELGYAAVAITDRNTLAGVVRAHVAAKEQGIRFLPGCRLDLQDGASLLAYPRNLTGYKELSALLTLGNLRAEKGDCQLFQKDIQTCSADLLFIVVPPDTLNEEYDFDKTFYEHLKVYRDALKHLYIAAATSYNGEDRKRFFRLGQIAARMAIPMVVTNDVYYHIAERRELQDVITCIREHCTIETAGYRLHANAERYLKPVSEMERLFLQYPDALSRTIGVMEQCNFSLDELKYEYPEEITTEGRNTQEELTMLAWQGAHDRYGDTVPDKIGNAIRYELTFIEEMNYAAYFLTVYDLVRFARSKGILCQGRGSAANSTICYCLGITSVDPTQFDLLFERFISSARNEPPDIDVDFEHERREEVIQYIYEKYGRDRAAIVATVTTLHQKGAINDVGKAMGLSVDAVKRLSGTIWEFTNEWFDEKRIVEQGLNPGDRLLLKVLQLTQQYMGFPRQLGQHTGGFVITRGKLSDLCPIMNARMEGRTCIEWNKDDIDALGFLKIDVLALGMLTCIRKAFDLGKQHYGLNLTLANIPINDPAMFEMIGHADTIGVFQIESRAQQAMLPRMKPVNFYDLVIEVAIVRPGPIQGDMVHPYLRRRNKEEDVTYPSPELYEILKRTLGVPLFQEQAMQIAIRCAGFTPAEADALRRSMATFKSHGMVTKFEEKLIKGMLQNGYELDYAKRIFKQLEGFGSYGFPESHAASFALLVNVSAWLKCHYPDVFAGALLNSMPMGFYAPAQIVIDARNHGVVVRPVDVNLSQWDNTLEEQAGRYKALRLGFRQVKGLKQEDVEVLVANRQQAYTHLNQLRDMGIPVAVLERLAYADTFRSMGMDRREALWEASRKDAPVGIFRGTQEPDEEEDAVQLPLMADSEQVVHDYGAVSLSLKSHPVSFVREKLQLLHILPTGALADTEDGQLIKVAGLVLVRQRPGTASGICFMTIEDETGNANLVIFKNLFDQYRKEILQSQLIMVEGKVQKAGEVVHVVVHRCHNLNKLLRTLTPAEEAMPVVQVPARGDERDGAYVPAQPPKEQEIQSSLFGHARNFK
ncbi:error-prone DNA polymerase [Paraflavitalea pollutisoli]|uniref:error-prone DNA polymerase n=1 Tax=Paraflavitalea pollutisoli TaxID=3034143 RepID=UPI0023ED921E|nr:error-prone DNA polymerase [Paraflavitalea sp. H1-2-19X]